MNNKPTNINKFSNVLRSPLKLTGLVAIVLIFAGIATGWTYTTPPLFDCVANGTCYFGNMKMNETTLIAQFFQGDASNITAVPAAQLTGTAPLAAIPATLTGKDADTVDGYHLNQGVRTTDSPTFASVNSSYYNTSDGKQLANIAGSASYTIIQGAGTVRDCGVVILTCTIAINGSTLAVDYSGSNAISVVNQTVSGLKNKGGGTLTIGSGDFYATNNNEFIDISGLNDSRIKGSGATTRFFYNRTDSTGDNQDIFKASTSVQNLEIAGIYFRMLQTKAASGAHSYISITGNGSSNIKIHHNIMNNSMSIKADNTSDYSPHYGIQLHKTTDAQIYNNDLRNFAWYPIENEQTVGAIIADNYITTAFYGLTGGSSTIQRQTVIRDNIIKPADNYSAITTGIELENMGGEVIIKGNIILNATGTAGIRIYRGSGTNNHDSDDIGIISDNIIFSADYPITVEDYRAIDIHGNNFIDNQRGILIENVSSASVYGNTYDSMSVTYTNVVNSTTKFDSENNDFGGHQIINAQFNGTISVGTDDVAGSHAVGTEVSNEIRSTNTSFQNLLISSFSPNATDYPKLYLWDGGYDDYNDPTTTGHILGILGFCGSTNSLGGSCIGSSIWSNVSSTATGSWSSNSNRDADLNFNTSQNGVSIHRMSINSEGNITFPNSNLSIPTCPSTSTTAGTVCLNTTDSIIDVYSNGAWRISGNGTAR